MSLDHHGVRVWRITSLARDGALSTSTTSCSGIAGTILYLAQLQIGATSTISVIRNVGGAYVLLATSAVGIPASGKVKLSVVGSRLQVPINTVVTKISPAVDGGD